MSATLDERGLNISSNVTGDAAVIEGTKRDHGSPNDTPYSTDVLGMKESIHTQESDLVNNSPSSQETSVGKASDAPERPFSIYTLREKWIIVGMASIAGVLSPLSSQVFLPALPALAVAFHKSVELINLTVTMYLVMQGVAPMFWGSIADRWGRRLIFLSCMLVLSLSCIGLALVPTNAYWLLMLLRCLQAAGSASTIALGAGVIADVATRAERGSFFGVYTMGPLIGPCIGPVLGGGLADGLGWRAIFWFVCIASSVCFIFLLLFLPETLRALVGDGSIAPPPIHRPLMPLIGRAHSLHPQLPESERPPPRKFMNPFRILIYPDIALLLFFTGIICAVWNAVTASISTLFAQTYPFLNETDVGLCFLAIGGGMFIGSSVNGRLLDSEYRRVKERMEREAEVGGEKVSGDVTKDENFPIELARFRLVPVYYVMFLAAAMGYGWCLQEKVSIAGPLVMLFVVGFTANSIMNSTQTLIVDLLPDQGSSVTACNNLVRCSLSAASVSVMDIIFTAVGVGWTFVIFAALCVAVGPIMFLVIRWGPKFRASRRAKADKGR